MNVNARIALSRSLVYSRALCRVLSSFVSPYPQRRMKKIDKELGWSIYFALRLYTELLVVDERREDQLPAWEGILLVKESKQAPSANMQKIRDMF